LLARTDPDAPKHQGLTYFICDMEVPGVEVRPLRQLTGEAEFNEVFLTDVVVRDQDRIGPVGAGWKVAVGTLSNERVAFAVEEEPRESGMIARLLEAWRESPREEYLEPELVDLWVEAEALRLLRNRLIQTRDSHPGPEGSAAKLAAADFQQSAAAFWVELAGDGGLRYSDWTMRRPIYHDPSTRDASYGFLRSRANSIEGGTSQIMRNIIGERVLGLPEEPRVDRGIPWRELPR
jgi:alkylation response protein AidB-like acyl-CoA dehydrogenase